MGTLMLVLADLEDLRESGLGSLFVDHFCEVGRDAGVRGLDPYWDRYEALRDAGRLVIWTVEHDGDTVGYALSVLCEHMHNADQVQLINDAIYVKPTARRLGVGRMLMEAMESTAKEYEADIVWHAPAHSRLDRILAGSRSYRPTFTAYTKPYEAD